MQHSKDAANKSLCARKRMSAGQLVKDDSLMQLTNLLLCPMPVIPSYSPASPKNADLSCGYALKAFRFKLPYYSSVSASLQGDAFVLAFHTVADALLFAASSQVELLLAAWPAELLELEVRAL
eukprot:scaffold180471_cov19-Tisochrysis_lutea.AAC.1